MIRLTLVLMSCRQRNAAPSCLLIDTAALFSAAPITCVNLKATSHKSGRLPSVKAICPSHHLLSGALPTFSSAFLNCSLFYHIIFFHDYYLYIFFPNMGACGKQMHLLYCAQHWSAQQLESNFQGAGVLNTLLSCHRDLGLSVWLCASHLEMSFPSVKCFDL